MPAARFAFVFVSYSVCFLLFVIFLSGEPKQNQGRELVDRKLVQAPINFIAGRPDAALLFWFFGDFTCVLIARSVAVAWYGKLYSVLYN